MIRISCISSVYPLCVWEILPTFRIPFNPNAQSSTLFTNSRLAKSLFLVRNSLFYNNKNNHYTPTSLFLLLLIFVEVITQHFDWPSQDSSRIISTLKNCFSINNLCWFESKIYLTYVAPTRTTSVPDIICKWASLFPAGEAE